MSTEVNPFVEKIEKQIKEVENKFNQLRDKLKELDENQQKIQNAKLVVAEEMARLQGENRALRGLISGNGAGEVKSGAVPEGANTDR